MIKLIPRRYRSILVGITVIAPFVLNWILGIEQTVADTGSSGSATEQICQVSSIYDGDTMRVDCPNGHVKIRLNCIDAPEMQQKPWGKEARDYLRAISTPSVRVIGHKRDRYGRLIGEVWTHDDAEIQENLNLSMVRSGSAAVYPKYCKESQYYQAQEGAQNLAAGIWEKPGNWQQPWEYRKAKRQK